MRYQMTMRKKRSNQKTRQELLITTMISKRLLMKLVKSNLIERMPRFLQLSVLGLVQTATSVIPRILCQNTNAFVEDSTSQIILRWSYLIRAVNTVTGRSTIIALTPDVISTAILEVAHLAVFKYLLAATVEERSRECHASYPVDLNLHALTIAESSWIVWLMNVTNLVMRDLAIHAR